MKVVRIVALVSYKYDEDYLADLKGNLDGLVDEVILRYDDDGSFWKHEGQYRKDMLAQAQRAGADYVIVIDPDERLERSARRKLRQLAEEHHGEKVLFELNFRELYAPNKYRVDGLWGRKSRVMLFPLRPDNVYSDAKLHAPRQPLNSDYTTIATGLNVYHLKHIEPQLRSHRKQIYNKLDPEGALNGDAGYDYLDDETGMELVRIPLGRGYAPRYRQYRIDPAIFDA